MEHYNMNLTLKVWRQKNSREKGNFETYDVKDISSEMSFLEMFDVLNEKLIAEGRDPITFDHDCREGICGACSMYIDGQPHGLLFQPGGNAYKLDSTNLPTMTRSQLAAKVLAGDTLTVTGTSVMT